MPTADAATWGRDASKKSMAMRKPWPSSPSSRSTEMRARSRTSEPVYDARRPSFASLRPAATPGSSRSMRKAVTAPSTLAKTMEISAMPPFVM